MSHESAEGELKELTETWMAHKYRVEIGAYDVAQDAAERLLHLCLPELQGRISIGVEPRYLTCVVKTKTTTTRYMRRKHTLFKTWLEPTSHSHSDEGLVDRIFTQALQQAGLGDSWYLGSEFSQEGGVSRQPTEGEDMAKTKKAKLGKTYVDTVSGFEGIATANYEYLNGCVRVELTGKVSEKGKGEIPIFVFDIGQVELKKDVEKAAVNRRQTGGPQSHDPVR